VSKVKVKMNQETLDSSSEHKASASASKAEKKKAKSKKSSKDDKPKKSKKSSKTKESKEGKEVKKKSKRKLTEGGDLSIDSSSLSLSIGSEVEISSNDESKPARPPGKSGAEQGSDDPDRKPQRPVREKRSADQPRVKSNSVGVLDKRKHERDAREKPSPASASATSSDDESLDLEQALADPDRKPQRPVRGKRSADQPRYKSSSVGALDKRKHERYARKRASTSDDDSGVEISEISSENETIRLPREPRPPRKSGAGQPKMKSKSVGVLEQQAQSLFLKRKGGSDDDASSDDDSIGRASRSPRPPRGRRTTAQPRMKSNSVGALDKKKQELYLKKAGQPSGSNFMKPRRLSSGALKAKAHVQRSVQESSLHLAQPDIKLAIPRVKSKGALNARRTDASPRRNAKDPLRKWSDSPSPLDKSPDGIPRSMKDLELSPLQRKAQSERNFRRLPLATDSPDESSSSDSDDFGGPILPLPPLNLNLRSNNRDWAESKQAADQMPSMDKALSASARSLNDETWQEALRDEDDDKERERARKRYRKERRKKGRLVPKKRSSLPQAALPPELLTPNSHKDPKKMSRNLKALLSPGVLQDQKDRRRRERRTKKIHIDQQGKQVRSPSSERRKNSIGSSVEAVLDETTNDDQSLVDPNTHTQD
jgi:hypothetical protein